MPIHGNHDLPTGTLHGIARDLAHCIGTDWILDEVTTYTAVYERDDNGNWLVEIAEEPRIRSWGRTLAAAQKHIRDAVALWYEVEPDSFALTDDVRLPPPVAERLAVVQQARGTLERFSRLVADGFAQTAKAIADAGLSLRDTAKVMNISHQRVHQLMEVARRPPSPRDLPSGRELEQLAEMSKVLEPDRDGPVRRR